MVVEQVAGQRVYNDHDQAEEARHPQGEHRVEPQQPHHGPAPPRHPGTREAMARVKSIKFIILLSDSGTF